MDDLKKNPSYCFFTTILHRPATPIIRTGLNISLHLQIYILVDLKDMSRNIYKTSMYNRNLRVSTCWRALTDCLPHLAGVWLKYFVLSLNSQIYCMNPPRETVKPSLKAVWIHTTALRNAFAFCVLQLVSKLSKFQFIWNFGRCFEVL